MSAARCARADDMLGDRQIDAHEAILEEPKPAPSIAPIPKATASDIRALNDLRNGLAHSFFPENRRKSKPEWKGRSVFSIEGATRFQQDMEAIWNFFTGLYLAKDDPV
jgi:hypothetical protein